MLKNKKLIIIVVAVVVVLAVAVAVLFGTGVLGNKDNTDTNKTTESTAENTNDDIEGATHEYIKVDDKKYPVVVDHDGNPIINDKNQVKILKRDEKNKIVTNEAGEPQTEWMQIEDKCVTDNKFYNKYYTVSVPDGWKITSAGAIAKEDTDGKCYITIQELTTKGYEDKPLNELLAKLERREENSNSKYIKNGFTVKSDKKDIKITDEKIAAVYKTRKIVNKSNVLADYSEKIYFELEDHKKFAVILTCSNETAFKAVQNSKFDLVDFINKNIELS